MGASEAVPGIGVIFVALSLAFLEWLAWSPFALVLVFGALILTFGGLMWANISSARDARRIADAIEREERRNRKR